MIRRMLKTLAVALVAVFTLAAAADAAPKRAVRHRPKHSTRVASGTSTTTTKKKPPTKSASGATTTPTPSPASV